jgi:hypothetical protein
MQIYTLSLLELIVTYECDTKCRLLDSCPGFKFLRINIMAGPSTKMRVSDEEVLHEYSDISEKE